MAVTGVKWWIFSNWLIDTNKMNRKVTIYSTKITRERRERNKSSLVNTSFFHKDEKSRAGC